MSNFKCLTVFSNNKNEFPLNSPPIFNILIFYFKKYRLGQLGPKQVRYIMYNNNELNDN